MTNQPGNNYYLCPLAGLRKGDTILLEAELISDYRLAEVVKTQYLKDNFHVQVVYRNEDGEVGSFTRDEFDTVYLRRPEHIVPDESDDSVCLGSTSPQLYVYVGPPETPYEQPCIHCKAAEAIQPTLYCQPCLDALGQEWLRNYELGLLHSTLPAFFESVAMIAMCEAVEIIAMSESEVQG